MIMEVINSENLKEKVESLYEQIKSGLYSYIEDELIKEEDKIPSELKGKAVSSKEYIYLALAYYRKEEKNKAVFYLKKVISLDNNNIDAHFNLAEIYLQLEKYEKAKDHALRIIQENPKDWAVHDILASIYEFEGTLS